MFIWLGKGASDREKIGAEEAVEAISNKAEGINKVTVKEGEEDDTFWWVWKMIGGTQSLFQDFVKFSNFQKLVRSSC